MATSFNINKADLTYILRQIKIAEAHVASGAASPIQAIMNEYGASATNAAQLPAGLRTVSGEYNNLLPGKEQVGAADNLFPRLTDPVFQTVDGPGIDFNGDGIYDVINHNYGDASAAPGTQLRSVADSDPRTISNLIVDMSVNNPAAIDAFLNNPLSTGAFEDEMGFAPTAAYFTKPANHDAANLWLKTIPNQSPDIGLSPGFNSWMTFFGQFFDHGLDLVTKGANGTVYIPLLADDTLYDKGADGIANNFVPQTNALGQPLYYTTNPALNPVGAPPPATSTTVTAWAAMFSDDGAGADGKFGTLDDRPNFMALTRATATIDANGIPQHENTTTPWIDQNQTYTSHESHQVFLRAYVREGDVTYATGKLLGGYGSTIYELRRELVAAHQGQLTWADVLNYHGSGEQIVNHIDMRFDNFQLLPYGQNVDINGDNVIGAGENLQAYLFNEPNKPWGEADLPPGQIIILRGLLQAIDPGANLDFVPVPGTLYQTALTLTLGNAPEWGALANGTYTGVDVLSLWFDPDTLTIGDQFALPSSLSVANPAVLEAVNALLTASLNDHHVVSNVVAVDLPGITVEGGIGNWADVKHQAIEALGLTLNDFDVHNVPLLKADPYGKFIPGTHGFAQVAVTVSIVNATTGATVSTVGNTFVEGVDGGLDIHALTSANLPGAFTLPALGANQAYKVAIIGTGHAFLNDIAHHAAPGKYDADGDGFKESNQVADTDPGTGDDGLASTYDDEMLNSHFVTGDGRGNENIALTTVHSIFHSEHDRIVDVNKHTILDSGDLAFINEWLRVDIASLADIATPEQKAALIANQTAWDGERLFQAARFGTEMQYQHLVFEEFARRIQPAVNPFVFNNSPEIDPSITAEFAHTVYRFGHSMLTGTVDRLENDLTTVNGEMDQKSLLAVFLNPQQYYASGDDLQTINANIIRGLSRDVGNEIDEFIVSDVRDSLVGLPLDLGALNIARGRDTGIPSLNDTRSQLYNDTGLVDLKPYTSWVDFADHIKNPLSVINFIAAYGTHSSITSATTMAEKRAAAEALVFGGAGSPADRLAFLNATGAYAPDGAGPNDDTLGGLNLVDLWIGGLAEAKNEFGGMLGSTFNYVFEAQMENLQNGDRMYYLSRTQGTNFLMNLEPNTFSDLVMRNTDLGAIYATHLNGALFVTPDHILELDKKIAQEEYGPQDYNGADPGSDPVWAPGEPHSVFATKVVRDYTTAVRGVAPTVGADGHNIGGTIKFIGGEHLVLGGTEGNDALYGDRGIDTIWGDGGNDYINAGTESDDVFGGEGDDIIEDPFGDDVLRGNQGNDVVSSARGADILFGDEGNDFIKVGQDASEVFGGEGDDFILGGDGGDTVLGNEGDDWIEGGRGFDGIDADNSELFFNSPIIGHDVMFGQADECDYEGESGDDIMGSGASVFRYGGQAGFDWAIGKGENNGVYFDMNIGLVATVPNDILRDRFDLIEGASGAQYNDTIIGDNRGSALTALDPILAFDAHVLTQEGIDRITGLNAWLDDARATLQPLLKGPDGQIGTGDGTFYRDGNLIMGGDGSDVLSGHGGYDIIDGDAYLNVRIKIVHNGVTYSAESLNTDTSAMGPNAGFIFNTNPDGSPNFASKAFGGVSLQSLLLNGTINPGEMSIVREILYDTTNVSGPGSNIDTAVFQGSRAEYDIEGQTETTQAGDTTLSYSGRIEDVNGDGFISITDKDTGTGATFFQIVGGVATLVTNPVRRDDVGKVAVDDMDLIKNIEHIKFSDVTLSTIRPTLDLNSATAGINHTATFTENGAAVAIGSLPTITTDNGSILSAHIVLTDFQAGDVISVAGGLPGGIVAGPVINNGNFLTINLTGASSAANYQAAIGQIRYSNTTDAPGDALRTIEVTVTDASGDSAPATASVTVVAVNDAVTAVADSIITNASGVFTVTEAALLANDIDPDGPLLDITSVNIIGGQLAQATLGAGFITLADNAAANGNFTYVVNDGGTPPTTSTGNVSVTTQGRTQYSDNFNNVNNNSQGASVWASNWVETGDDGVLTTGEIQIDGGNSNQLRFLVGNGATITRAVNLANTANVSLTFNVGQTGLDADDSVVLQFDANGDGIFETVLSTITVNSPATTGGNGAATTITANLTGGTANSAIRFVATSIENGENARIDNLSINFANTNADVTGTAAGEILVGNDNGTNLNGLAGNDMIFAGGGDDVITQAVAGGRDFIDGGTNGAVGDRLVINGDATAETFVVYARADALTAGLTGLNANTEIVITRNGAVISELDNVEEITINTAAGADTVTAIGNFNGTSLFFNTITATGDSLDRIDASGLTSAHHLVFQAATSSGGATTTIDSITSVLVEPAASGSNVLPAPASAPVPQGIGQGLARFASFHANIGEHLASILGDHSPHFKAFFADDGLISM